MKATLSCLAALFLAAAAVSPARADGYFYSYAPARVAPDMCGPPYYYSCYGQTFAQYCVYPPFMPWNGFRPNMNQQNATMLGIHPFARSPRDFFMRD